MPTQAEKPHYSTLAPHKEDVQQMFDDIAHSYDGLNHTLSFGIDHSWRKRAIKYLAKNGNYTSILDVATGTGDFAILANKMLHPSRLVGIDISDKMLEIGKRKVEEKGMSSVISFSNEDCSDLSFDDNSFDAVISAFALRNFEHLDKCLSEMYRVMKPGGRIAVIDLCTPRKAPMKQLFWCYKKMVMPVIGRIVSHNDTAYSYLPHTMDIIPQGNDMLDYFISAGFKNAEYRRLKFQMCILYTAQKQK